MLARDDDLLTPLRIVRLNRTGVLARLIERTTRRTRRGTPIWRAFNITYGREMELTATDVLFIKEDV